VPTSPAIPFPILAPHSLSQTKTTRKRKTNTRLSNRVNLPAIFIFPINTQEPKALKKNKKQRGEIYPFNLMHFQVQKN